MKKSIVKVVVLLMMLLALSGCGVKEVSLEDIRTDVETITDIPMRGDEITEFEIIKRQTNIEEKEDIVYVHVEAKNTDFSVVRNYKLEYALYNEGWMLENYSAYMEDGYYDETIALHGVNMTEVEEFFALACDAALYIEPAFSSACYATEGQPIQNNYFEANVDSYTQKLILYYDYFVQEVTVKVDFVLNGFIWEPNMYVTETIVLSDNINGTWSAYVEESHPLIDDWTISGTIVRIDDLNCNYQFVKTSGVRGGDDDEIEGTKTIEMKYDSEGNLEYINLGEYSQYYKLRIIPEGIAWMWTWGTGETYILYK